MKKTAVTSGAPSRKFILGLETSTHSGGAALLSFEGGSEPGERMNSQSLEMVGSICVTTKQLYSQRLLPSIEWLLDRAQVSVDDISVIGISVGPGSFTGLRIGLSVAKALAYASGAKLIGVGTLEALAVRASGGRDALVCPLLDARHGQVYSALYRVAWNDGLPQIETVHEDWAGPIEDIAAWITEPVIFAGDAVPLGVERLRPILKSNFLPPPPHYRLPSPDDVAMLTAARAASEKFDDVIALEPRYVRQSYIK